ncbi:hypothetical protein HP439_04580 [Sphingobacterium shayense]|uniref:relaxase/mobilization nuclease domain-containing protein n=1 Tax=Sphingobacterium shayense TaxID=626343 RepID=UPI0015570899|nr:hypothetical protein [Sphingobacterium shayense]NQD69997.1 hypothetical protein [Sphingobacterium shayense]
MTAISLSIFKHNATFKGVNYNMRKVSSGDAELLSKANFDALACRENPSADDFKNYLQAITRSNKDLLCRQFHAAIGTREKSISTKSLAKVAERWLWEMGYKGQPYLIFGHYDTPNPHVHIVSSRITSSGKLIPSQLDVRRGREAMNKILGIDLDANTKKAFEEAMSYRFISIEQFKTLLNTMGYNLTNKSGELRIYFGNVLRLAVPLEQVLERASRYHTDDARLTEIRTLFESSKNSVNPALYELNRYMHGRWATRFTGWDSKMIQLLEQQLDIKIIFENSYSELPHDYMIIDRKHKHIYNGEQLMPLAEFTKEQLYRSKSSEFEPTDPARNLEPISPTRETDCPMNHTTPSGKPAGQQDPQR